MDFGQWLFQARKRADLTQPELSARTDGKVAVSTISSLERGERKPSVNNVDRLARALGADLNEARHAAGYAPINAPGPTITLEDIGQLAFQKDLAKPERERIERLIRTVLAADKMQRDDDKE